jgi:hypothetical protein
MKKYFRIMLEGEPRVWFDYAVPEGAQLDVFVAHIQSAGYFCTSDFYIAAKAIKFITTVTMENNNVQPFKPTVVS